MEDLGFESIMDFDDLFGGVEGNENGPVQQETENPVDKAEVDGNNEPTEVNPDQLFGGLETSESVGVDNDKGGEDNKNPENTDDSSPNFYSSILSALKDDGVLPELTDEEIDGYSKNKEFNDQDFNEVIEKVIDSRLDQRTKRIQDALNGGADIEEVKQYENILATLSNIDDGTISEEGPKGEDLRRRIIAQDYMNKGFSKERIERELKKSFDAGTDIDDAKEALQNNIQFYQDKYQGIIRQGQEADRKFKEDTRKQAEDLKKSIVDSKDDIFDQIGVDKKTRQKIYDSISKPVYQDNAGNWYTEIQKYEMEHKTDFLKYVAMFYKMTDGFSNMERVFKKPVQKKVNSAMSELQKKLQNTQRNSSGNLKLVGQGDPESQSLGNENFILDGF